VLIADVGLRVDFAAGEELRTEISAKFTQRRLQQDFAAAGLRLDGWFVDAARPVRAVLAARA